MAPTDFRTRQVLADLERVIDTGEDSDPVDSDLWAAVFRPTINRQDLYPAVASVLLHLVKTATRDPQLDVLWSRHLPTLRATPAPIRAALMQAFEHLRQHHLAPEECRPRPDDLITARLQDLEPLLIARARQMTLSEIDHISRADYGCDVARHKAALILLLADPHLAYPPAEVWFPAEVVELVSHLPGAPGHVPCLAIVLLDALRSGDHTGNARNRLESQFLQIAGLPEAPQFFAAFRHLYEADGNWNPTLPEHVTLPWA